MAYSVSLQNNWAGKKDGVGMVFAILDSAPGRPIDWDQDFKEERELALKVMGKSIPDTENSRCKG